jgi:hypothetical protein
MNELKILPDPALNIKNPLKKIADYCFVGMDYAA